MATKFRILKYLALTGEYFTVQRKKMLGWCSDKYENKAGYEVSHTFGNVEEAERYIEGQVRNLERRNAKPKVVKEILSSEVWKGVLDVCTEKDSDG